MVLRVIVAIVGVLIVLTGLAELILPHRWFVGLTQGFFGSRALVITGVVEIILGLLFIGAVLAREVGLGLYVLLFGIYMAGAGIMMLLYPAHFRSIMDLLFLKQTPLGQAAILWMTGLLRIIIGVGLLYAAVMVPVRRVVEPVP